MDDEGYRIELAEGGERTACRASPNRSHRGVYSTFWISKQESYRLDWVLAEMSWHARQCVEALDLEREEK